MEIKITKKFWLGSFGSHPSDYILMIKKFCDIKNFFKNKNRSCICNARKHGPRHFEKPTDRAVNSSSENFDKCNKLGHMLWFININKNLAPAWSLRPPMDSHINFEILNEYVTNQIWSKFYSTKHISNKENHLLSSETTFSGFSKFLTLAKRNFLLLVPHKATIFYVYLLSGEQCKQDEEIHKMRRRALYLPIHQFWHA